MVIPGRLFEVMVAEGNESVGGNEERRGVRGGLCGESRGGGGSS